jgi:hypothetical protein
MSRKARNIPQKGSSGTQYTSHFVWPLGKSSDMPDEMNTSFGPRIDANLWDFHNGIDEPAPCGTPVYAMADGIVHRAGPADKIARGRGFGSTHVLLKVIDPIDGEDDLFLVYLHLDSIAEGVIPGAHVSQGDVIGAVGHQDAEYCHLHYEFRKGEPKEENSVHPLHYLPYLNTANVTQLRLDRCNFYRVGNDDKRMVRLRFDVANRREGDVQGVDVELKTEDGVAAPPLHVNFDDRTTIVSDKGDEHAFKNGIAVEGYQKSDLKGEGLNDLHYGVIVKHLTPEFTRAKLQVLDVKNENLATAEFFLPTLGSDSEPVNSLVGFGGQTFPPRGWEVNLLPGNVCQPDALAAISGSRGLLCQDLQSPQGPLIRAGLRFALPVDRSPVLPMSWRLRADIRPAELQMRIGRVMHTLAFSAGDDVMAAACLRKLSTGELVAGVLIRSADGLFRERIDVNEGTISMDDPLRWELELLRIGTRQTTAVLRLGNNVVARINGDTTGVEPDTACVGILHRYSGLKVTLYVDNMFLTEAPG